MPSIPWFEYKIAYEKTKPLLNLKGSPQRGIFESTRCMNLFMTYLLE